MSNLRSRLDRLDRMARQKVPKYDFTGAREALEQRLDRMAEKIEQWRQERGLTLGQLRDHLLQHGSEAELLASGVLTVAEALEMVGRWKVRADETAKKYHLA